jgi:Subtilase family
VYDVRNMPPQQTARILIKAAPAAVEALAGKAFRLDGDTFTLQPLFRGDAAQQGFGLTTEPAWFIADTRTPVDDQTNLWELAHRAADAGLGLAGASVAYAEPDLLQKFVYDLPVAGGLALNGDRCASDSPISKAPNGPGFAWHLRDDYSGLGQARAAAAFGEGVRIGILDTGYDPDHTLLPAKLQKELGVDFAEEGRTDATDPDLGGLLQNPGHGTGTICILAGNRRTGLSLPPEAHGDDFYGGAPLADVIPVRIANSVILFHNSALARGLDYLLEPKGDPALRVDVVSISMGGAAAGPWADAVNRAYELGVCIVAAAGNGKPGGFPTRNIVFPARFRRVIAACGAMADHKPYAGLPDGLMEGNFGPTSKMPTAMGAFTPNVGWAKLGCKATIDLDGAGTSSSTPQIAAAAALWLAKNKDLQFAEKWQRVEAVRKALFDGAQKDFPDREKFFGNGQLDAVRALGIRPALQDLKQTDPDSASFALFRIFTGLGVAMDDSRKAMFELEMTQLAQRNPELERILPDPDDPSVGQNQLRQFVEAVAENSNASRDLRLYLAAQYQHHFGGKSAAIPAPPKPSVPEQPVPQTPDPPCRRIRAFAFDPSLSLDLDNEALNRAIFRLPWESLEPGPKDEYLEVVDDDAAGNKMFPPVNLDDRSLLGQDGLPPQQDNPQFHQQMVYAVSRKTIQFFEDALGRPVFWSGHGLDPKNPLKDVWQQRIKILPHALNVANAFYSPERKALLFGAFSARSADVGIQIPGERVFTCLSHDIVAHETTHAILDGLHYRLREPVNPDMLAFHEGFADLVALFQHFAMRDVLEAQIVVNHGSFEISGLLTGLARQFGRATGKRGALRDAIGTANPQDYQTKLEPHERGSILVAAVFDAFLMIYNRRAARVIDIATAGSGVLPSGTLPQPLAAALAKEASDVSSRVLQMCIHALDYIPPVDVTYSDYLRAVITADNECFPDDPYGYRIAFVDAFRRRGIYPPCISTLSVTGLRWPALDLGQIGPKLAPLMKTCRDFAEASRYASSRESLFKESERGRIIIHGQVPRLLDELQLNERERVGKLLGLALTDRQKFEVHVLRIANRARQDGTTLTQVVLEVTQSSERHLDEDSPKPSKPFWFRGGSTLIIDLDNQAIRYAIVKDATDPARFDAQRDYLLNQGAKGLAYFRNQQMASGAEPFCLLHRETV